MAEAFSNKISTSVGITTTDTGASVGIGSTNIKFATTNDLSPLKTNYSNEPFLTGKLKTNYLTWDSKNIEGFTTPSLATQQDFRVKLLSKLEPDSVSKEKIYIYEFSSFLPSS